MKKFISKIRFNNMSVHFLTLVISIIASYIILAISNLEVFDYLYPDNQLGVNLASQDLYRYAIFIIGILIFISILYSISQSKNKLYIYLLSGANYKTLFRELARTYLAEFLFSYIIAIPIAIFFSEFINLTIIYIMNFNLASLKFSISIRALFLSFIVVLLIDLSGISLMSFYYNKRYPEKIYRNRSLKPILKVLIIVASLSLFKAFVPQLFYNFERSIYDLLIFLAGIFLFGLLLIGLAGRDNIILKSLIKNFISEYFVSIILSSFFMTVAITSLCDGISDYFVLSSNIESRPDFTVFADEENVKKLEEIPHFDDMVGEIYPVCLDENVHSDDASFKSQLYSFNEYRNLTYNKTNVMSFTTYKKIFKTDALESINDDETIFLFASDFYSPKMLDEIDEGIRKNKPEVKIKDRTYKVFAIDYSNKILANDTTTLDNMYVVSDNEFNNYFSSGPAKIWNIDLTIENTKTKGYKSDANSFRERLFDYDIRFESLVWFLSENYSQFLSILVIKIYICLIFSFVGISFLSIRILSYLDKNISNLNTLVLLGEEGRNLKKLLNKFINKIFVLVVLNVLIYNTYHLYIQVINNRAIYYILKTDGKIFILISLVSIIILLEYLYIRLIYNSKINSIEELN